MFRPLSRSHHQGVQNPWELQSHCIDLLECCYVYVFASWCDSCGMLSIPQLSHHDVNTYTQQHSNRSIQWLCNSQGFRTSWWWLRLRGRNMLEWLISNILSRINMCILLVYFCLHYWKCTVLKTKLSMTFAQRRNRLKTHFSERIPVVKQSIPVHNTIKIKL